MGDDIFLSDEKKSETFCWDYDILRGSLDDISLPERFLLGKNGVSFVKWQTDLAHHNNHFSLS